jgi:pimeloyl-ACP methyl ester carboxylesterase
LTPALSSEPLVTEITGLLAKPSRVEGIEFDTSDYFARAADGQNRPRTSLRHDYRWRPVEAGATPLVPLQLCEFLAYKTALAYESADRIRAYLERCHDGFQRIRVFDSSTDKGHAGRLLADAQGYGFVFERKAFVIFRGTTSAHDWKINRIDALTNDIGKAGDRRTAALRKAYGSLLDKLGDPNPGRHVGFSIAWAALKDEVEDWLADALEAGAIDQIVYSGHSLGGAMAQVAAFDHARIEAGFERDRGIAPSRVGAVVTFGAPAVGGTEFAAVYKSLLGDRTMLLESSGDLVPRIMNRWYYRMLYPLRQRVQAGVQAHLVATEGFGKVATPWTFASEPPMSDADIDAALSAIRDAAAKAARNLDAELKRRKEAEDAKAREVKSDPAGAEGKPGAGSQKAEPAPTWMYWVIGGVIVIVVAGVAWYFVRRKLFSHDIEQRYALYLSTLSYQQLRAKHGGDLALANAELAEHLRFVRGDPASSKAVATAIPAADGSSSAFFESIATLPVEIKVRNDPTFVEFLKKADTFV